MVCKNCGKEYFVCEKTDTYNWCKDYCSTECYSNTYKKEFNQNKYVSFPTILADKNGSTYEFGQQGSYSESEYYY